MSNVKDRSREFAATVESLIERNMAGIGAGMNTMAMDPLLSTAVVMRRARHQHHTEFTRRATEISHGIRRLLTTLERLTKRMSEFVEN